jgi:DUF4097 and DUF4098 domain-containing protein YvlB
MKRPSTSTLVAAALGTALSLTPLVLAQQSSDQITVPFTDPARQGTVRVSSLNGTITVHGANRRDVLIETRGGGRDDRNRNAGSDRSGGLRRLTQSAGFEAVEQNNQLTISTGINDEVALVIYVPTKTNLKVSGTNGGNMTIDGVDGDIEANNTNASITLTNVAGSVVAHSVNGEVKATLSRATPDKPMAFTSLNGNVDVTLPASVKATFKLRSDMGDVFTDFDLQLRSPSAAPQTRRENGQFRIEMNRSITGAANGGGPEIEMRTFNGSVYLRKGQ